MDDVWLGLNETDMFQSSSTLIIDKNLDQFCFAYI